MTQDTQIFTLLLLSIVIVLLIILFSLNIVYFIHKKHFVWLDESILEKKLNIKNGDKIEITYLPPCRNAPHSKNPYIGMQGEVQDFNGKSFALFTGNSYLMISSIKGLQIKHI